MMARSSLLGFTIQLFTANLPISRLFRRLVLSAAMPNGWLE
jgi:hypothetical protein